MKMIMPALMLTVLLIGTALSLAPVMADGPKALKTVSPLRNGAGTRWGQVIWNVNPEDDMTYELEVEIEGYMPFADSTVNVKLDGTILGTIGVDANGDGKATFYVTSFAPWTGGNTIEIVFAYSATPAMIALKTNPGVIDVDWWSWEKKSGQK